ncbi:hypothetical protein QTP88_013804 [Uroleucon formosanum]
MARKNIDFKKAYDSIHRESLINILREFHFEDKLIKLIEISILETFAKVRVGNIITDPILVKSGLRQEDAMSPILFNIVVEKVIREINEEGVKFQEFCIGLLGYADDLVIMEESQDGLKFLLNRLEKAAQKVGLHINEEKTEYMVREMKSKIEIEARIQSGNKCLYGLAKLLGSRSLSKDLKIQLYITLIRPVVTYGAETYPLRKSDERKLLINGKKDTTKDFWTSKRHAKR